MQTETLETVVQTETPEAVERTGTPETAVETDARIPSARGLLCAFNTRGQSLGLTALKKWAGLCAQVHKAEKVDVWIRAAEKDFLEELLRFETAPRLHYSARIAAGELDPAWLTGWKSAWPVGCGAGTAIGGGLGPGRRMHSVGTRTGTACTPGNRGRGHGRRSRVSGGHRAGAGGEHFGMRNARKRAGQPGAAAGCITPRAGNRAGRRA